MSEEMNEMQRGEVSEMTYLPLSELQTKISNIRTGDLPNIDELCQSISNVGLLQPISVRRGEDGAFDIVDGFRRFAALEQLHNEKGDEWDVVDFSQLPVVVSEGGNDSFVLLQQATSNLQRVDTAPEDLGSLCVKLMKEPYNMEVPQIASHLGKKSDFVLDLIKYVNTADKETKKLVRDGKMSFRQGVDSLELSEEQRESMKKLAKATKSKAEAKSKVKKAMDAAKGKDTPATGKKGAKEQEDRLMVCQGILKDKEIFSTLTEKEVEAVKGSISALEWALGKRNTLSVIPKKAEKAFLKKYEEAAKKEEAAAQAEKLKAKAEKAKAKAEEQAKKAAEAAEAAEAAANAAA